ncbi:DUF1800 domain-containing protein [Tropicibacter naphthalenivorans]|uniref:DUF1800 domain-containing protein n=1 Tax=Tropicibacter naphthalenivorans TaxID=441103 RepID=A0A0N7LYF3_9RHOB|nr:DUF1800 domain-containing protein [Tropicibacter naphthalenivorans]CUH74705.1 hypothetical protein TRN7648_00040 [Tropicibacter naphthalenivorans]SMC49665.1 Uncharacterized conserved protein, DUF1800 family [Tropicibacter naphthalenivorans]
MRFDPVIADIRFGCGRSPMIAAPAGVDAMLDGLRAPDAMAQRFPIEDFETFMGRMRTKDALSKILRQQRGTPAAEEARAQNRELNKIARKDHWRWMASHIARRIHSETPLRERLAFFWADHFTATGKGGVIRRGTSPYMQSALRPHLASRFSDLLFEAVTHPLMVHYLDQERSVGPGSARALKKPNKRFGINENLAREVLELHTMGADGPYTQDDVRQLAELLTGLTANAKKGRVFKKALAEPGAETVLGRSYGGAKPGLRDIRQVLDDLARHPATARHMAWKLAVHFVSDTPSVELIATIERAWLDSDGDLMAVYGALLRHPDAWVPARGNVKQPFDFITSACRALAVPSEPLIALREGPFRIRFADPLGLMGHIWQQPDGPDGLPEEDSAWITPQGIAARLQWAVSVPQLITPALPDPRNFVETALGPDAPEAVRFAASAAESRADGVGLVLASPAFQRM